jgi:hypothetical protein
MGKDKQRGRSRKELRRSKGHIGGGDVNDEKCTNVRKRF